MASLRAVESLIAYALPRLLVENARLLLALILLGASLTSLLQSVLLNFRALVHVHLLQEDGLVLLLLLLNHLQEVVDSIYLVNTLLIPANFDNSFSAAVWDKLEMVGTALSKGPLRNELIFQM